MQQTLSKCQTCQQIKSKSQLSGGLLKPLDIPTQKWECVICDFVVKVSWTQKKDDSIWVVVHRLMKSAHFTPTKSTQTMEYLARLYIDNIVLLHGVPKEIISDWDPLFTSHSWSAFLKAVGMEIKLSTMYHPHTNGQGELTIQVLEDLLRACTLDWGGDWEQHLPLVEFTYNNPYQANMGLAPFKALYGRPCRSPTCWLESPDVAIVGLELLQEATKNVWLIRQQMKAVHVWQKSYADTRQQELEF